MRPPCEASAQAWRSPRPSNRLLSSPLIGVHPATRPVPSRDVLSRVCGHGSEVTLGPGLPCGWGVTQGRKAGSVCSSRTIRPLRGTAQYGHHQGRGPHPRPTRVSGLPEGWPGRRDSTAEALNPEPPASLPQAARHWRGASWQPDTLGPGDRVPAEPGRLGRAGEPLRRPHVLRRSGGSCEAEGRGQEQPRLVA